MVSTKLKSSERLLHALFYARVVRYDNLNVIGYEASNGLRG